MTVRRGTCYHGLLGKPRIMGHDRHQTRAVETWLAAEHRSDDTAAETALQDLIRVLPAPIPPAGFAGRVMAAAARDRRSCACRRAGAGSDPQRGSWRGVEAAPWR